MLKTAKAPTPRQIALHILYDVETRGAYTDLALRRVLRTTGLERRDRAFITECVYGVVRWQGRIDWLLAQVCRRPLHTLTPWIRSALRLGVYQGLWMDRVPAWAVVHETVKLARRFGHPGTMRFVNGVLRTLLRRHHSFVLPDAHTQPVAHLAAAYSHPEWLVARWLERYGWERTRTLCDTNNRPDGITLRTNTSRTTPERLTRRLYHEGLRQIRPSRLVPEALIVHGVDRLDTLPSYHEGLFQVQDEGALLVAPLCQVQPGQRVLDVCAAPGGKTTHMAHLMHDTGRILACDVQPGRLHLLSANVTRLGLSSIRVFVADATRPLPLREHFDRILIDAPCSGLGVVRRHPDIKWRKTAADFAELQARQLGFLHTHHHLLAAAGVLVYSVCSHEPEETHDVVARFLDVHPYMRLDDVHAELPRPCQRPSAAPQTLELTPDQWHTDGVFVARFRRCTR
ncbi:Ribosomal RNA small subunit methyltransferase B [Candidatus Entotheonellaceae bacterium PAL068K]